MTVSIGQGQARYRNAMAVVEIFDDRRCALGEGPHYDEVTDRVMWVDILNSRLLWRSPGTGDTGETGFPTHIGAAVPRRGGGLVICLQDGPCLVDPTAPCGCSTPTLTAPDRRSNDAKADRAGRLWLGTMAYDERPGAGTLYRLDPGATTPVPVLAGVAVSNGLGWSPAGTTLYYVDSPTRRVDAIGFDPASGVLGARRPFAEIAPDGRLPRRALRRRRGRGMGRAVGRRSRAAIFTRWKC